MISRFVARSTLLELFGVILLGSILLLALAWQSPRPVTVDVGENDALYVAVIYGPEAGPAGLIRWTKGESVVKFPGIGGGSWPVT